ncbi:MAG TPA: hypothetical protein VMW17_23365 [Candidatus Binatia bacterium]|nr:hypothetical protein [Candidatus Binatia bacterium]
MSRIACLAVSNFPLTVVLRAEPELRGEPVAVADGPSARAAIIAVAETAGRRGITPGLTATQAQAVSTAIVLRSLSPQSVRIAHAALCDVAYSFSPRVESGEDGVVYLDVGGSGAMFDSEGQLAHTLARRAERVGLPAHVGVAGSKIAARLAAQQGGGVTVIPLNEECTYLAPLAVALLQPSPALAATLTRWGIRTIGQLAALPASAVGTRLGPEGLALARRARAEDEHPLSPRPAPLLFEEHVDLEYGIELLEPLLFILRGLLDRLTARVAVRGLVCGDLRLALGLSTHARDDRTIVVAPSNDVKALLTLMRLHLEAHPPAAPIETIRLSAVPERLRARQLDLFRPNGPAPEQLAVTLARLTALCGADHVGAPAVVDSHRPEAHGVTGLVGYGVKGGEEEGLLTPSPVTPTPLRIALRAIRPPQPLEVHTDRGRLDFIRGERLSGRVVSCAGPWRLAGEWWHDGAYMRDYYDVQLSDGGVYRLFCDRQHQWFVTGEYD